MDGLGWGWGREILGVRCEVSAGKEGGEGEGDKGGGLAEERGEVGVEGEVAGQMLETQVEGGTGNEGSV